MADAEPISRTILYVEDDDNDALFMRVAFEKQKLPDRLQIVSDGRKAIEYLSGVNSYGRRDQFPLPDLVLLDLNLPALSGFDVLEWIRSVPGFAMLPVIVFSSSSQEKDRARARALGASDFLQKPSSGFLFSEVIQAVRAKWL